MIPQSPQAAAPGQVEQHGFGVVVGIVGGGDHVSAHLLRRFLQKGIAHFPGGFLNAGTALCGLSGHIAAARHKGHTGTAGLQEGAHKVLVPAGFLSTQPVVIVGGGQGEAEFLPQLGQPMEQTHGIGSAGHGAQNVLKLQKALEAFYEAIYCFVFIFFVYFVKSFR